MSRDLQERRRDGRFRQLGDERRRWGRRLPNRSAEIFIQRVQTVGLEISKDPAQLLFDAVNGVKERSAIDLHLAAAESPVGGQEEVEAEHPVFKIIQRAAADQAEIRHIVFVLPHPGQSAVFSRTKRERHLAHVLFLGGAIPEACVTGAKDGAQYTVAGAGLASPTRAQSISMAMRAGSFRECEGL